MLEPCKRRLSTVEYSTSRVRSGRQLSRRDKEREKRQGQGRERERERARIERKDVDVLWVKGKGRLAR